MKKIFQFMRYFQLINCRIMIHAFNEMKCLLRGGRLKPSFDPKTINQYIKNLENGIVKTLPMGAYEYDCCVEYLKKIRHELFKNWNDFEELMLEFTLVDDFGLVIAPLEDCLEMVTTEVGFEITDEEIGNDYYKYQLKRVH